MAVAAYQSREKIEVYRFPLPVAIAIPALAIFLQAFVPVKFRFFEIFDLPLLVTIFFAVARRSQISGLLTGCAIGLAQDALGHHPIGVYGIAKTVVGWGASSLGVKIDVENPGSRLLLTFGFYLLHQAVYFVVDRGLVGDTAAWMWGRTLVIAAINAVLAVPMFAVLDRFKQRA
ncbi:MAG TPA: rod shape-determining protein MreD [Terriglobales bacterium]|nr:rod shape-determining protein MreD [Terriglobales bacterium]